MHSLFAALPRQLLTTFGRSASFVISSFAFYGIIAIASSSAQIQNIRPSQTQDESGQFDIYCDANLGGTGSCWRVDDNSPLDCEYASQEFIECQSRISKKRFICLYYSSQTLQFACKQAASPGSGIDEKILIRGGTRITPSTPNKPDQPIAPDTLKPDLIDVFD